MIGSSSAPKSGEGTWLWLFKIITGPLIIIILLIHLVVNHLVAEGGLLTWADVVCYYTNPLVPLMEIVFLILVVSHSLLGLRSVILDLKPSRAVLKVIDILFIIIGITAIVYGIRLIFIIVSFGLTL